ncbi:MAG TPA: metallophosphoesterase [Gaiellaceae bacterium]|jgi:predicted phosphodiesterase|nr:metallophosphoesterase [Gaiellaceae bacterium]
MRVALLSDMHGNAVAFRAALADLEARGKPDLIVALGDVAQGGPQPRECVELLQELDCACVYGNSDHFLVTLDSGDEPVTEQQLTTAEWSREQLGEEGLAFLRGFDPTVTVGRVICCHATPTSIEDVVLPTADDIEPVDADAVAAGHVHQQWLRRFGRTLWFCVGAIGISPHCEYALVDDETLAVEFRRIPFDLDRLIADARAKDFPFFDRWVESWKE